MPKGKMTGNPTNIVCWLLGGYYDDSVWGIAYDKDNLLQEIQMTYYENPRAQQQGIKILGITHTGPDDVLKESVYELVYFQEDPPAFAMYICKGTALEEAWVDDSDQFLNLFTHTKGYDLPDEYLDPKNMPGETKEIEL